MSSDEVKDFVENVSDAITKNPNDKKEKIALTTKEQWIIKK